MKSILNWVFTPLFLLAFGGVLVILHPLQIFGRLFGERSRLFALDALNKGVLLALGVAGTRVVFERREDIPSDRPLIIISNHQSMFDIPFIHWTFRAFHPSYIAKQELGRFIPSISYALRSGAGILIDRKDPKASVKAISEFARSLQSKKGCVSIFPEGTRARNGEIKKFKSRGVATLLEQMPDAVVVPAAISRSWELVQDKFLPIPFGVTVTVKVLEPILPPYEDPEELVSLAHERIAEAVNRAQGSESLT